MSQRLCTDADLHVTCTRVHLSPRTLARAATIQTPAFLQQANEIGMRNEVVGGWRVCFHSCDDTWLTNLLFPRRAPLAYRMLYIHLGVHIRRDCHIVMPLLNMPACTTALGAGVAAVASWTT
jgi:hypothetical protein